MENNKISGRQIAEQVFKKFAAGDVYFIARNVGVKIVYEKWFPVTIGEYDRLKKTIFVNLNAAENDEKIIAHELGHFFAQGLDLGKTEEEIFAQRFADYFAEWQTPKVVEDLLKEN